MRPKSRGAAFSETQCFLNDNPVDMDMDLKTKSGRRTILAEILESYASTCNVVMLSMIISSALYAHEFSSNPMQLHTVSLTLTSSSPNIGHSKKRHGGNAGEKHDFSIKFVN